MCLNLPKHVARVFCLLWRKRGYFLFWWRGQHRGCSLNSIWQSKPTKATYWKRDVKYIFWTLITFRRKNVSMLPNPQNGSLMKLVVDLQNVLFPQAFLIPPTSLYLHKNSKSSTGWKLLLHLKNHLKLAIVLQQSWGDWRAHRQMLVSVYAVPTFSFPSFLPPSHNAITETWFSLRNQKKKVSLSYTSESELTFGNHSWFISVWELIKLWGLMRLFRNRSARTMWLCAGELVHWRDWDYSPL